MHAAYWSRLLSALARPSRGADQWAVGTRGPVLRDEPVTLSLHTLDARPRGLVFSTSATPDTVYLAQDPVERTRWHGTFWPPAGIGSPRQEPILPARGPSGSTCTRPRSGRPCRLPENRRLRCNLQKKVCLFRIKRNVQARQRVCLCRCCGCSSPSSSVVQGYGWKASYEGVYVY